MKMPQGQGHSPAEEILELTEAVGNLGKSAGSITATLKVSGLLQCIRVVYSKGR